jgi:TrmH family RNA methyltransferase
MHPAVRIVLVRPSHPGNIGASARAMKTMGYADLTLVRPRQFPHAEATARASGADDVLAAARVCASLEEALQDCSVVAGSSARLRALPWPLIDARECARRVTQEWAGQRVALLFGGEHSGLTNVELARCHYHVYIPGNPSYRSLNLAAAVQILTYELHMAEATAVQLGAGPVQPGGAPQQHLEGFFAHLRRVLVALGILHPQQPRRLERRLRRLFQRAHPDTTEINILRGILRAVERRLRERGGQAPD